MKIPKYMIKAMMEQSTEDSIAIYPQIPELINTDVKFLIRFVNGYKEAYESLKQFEINFSDSSK